LAQGAAAGSGGGAGGVVSGGGEGDGVTTATLDVFSATRVDPSTASVGNSGNSGLRQERPFTSRQLPGSSVSGYGAAAQPVPAPSNVGTGAATCGDGGDAISHALAALVASIPAGTRVEVHTCICMYCIVLSINIHLSIFLSIYLSI